MTGKIISILRSIGAKSFTGRHRETRKTPFLLSSEGISLVELVVVLAIILVLFFSIVRFMATSQKKAHDIAAKSDLRNFATIVISGEYMYEDMVLATPNQKLCHDRSRVDFTLPNFTLSKGVCITILSGNPRRLNDKENPYIASSRYKDSTTIYNYNFATKILSDREASKDGKI